MMMTETVEFQVDRIVSVRAADRVADAMRSLPADNVYSRAPRGLWDKILCGISARPGRRSPPTRRLRHGSVGSSCWRRPSRHATVLY